MPPVPKIKDLKPKEIAAAAAAKPAYTSTAPTAIAPSPVPSLAPVSSAPAPQNLAAQRDVQREADQAAKRNDAAERVQAKAATTGAANVAAAPRQAPLSSATTAATPAATTATTPKTAAQQVQARMAATPYGQVYQAMLDKYGEGMQQTTQAVGAQNANMARGAAAMSAGQGYNALGGASAAQGRQLGLNQAANTAQQYSMFADKQAQTLGQYAGLQGDFEKMGINYGYDVSKMGMGQQNTLAQMAAANGYSTQAMQTQFNQDMQRLSQLHGYSSEDAQKAQQFALDRMAQGQTYQQAMSELEHTNRLDELTAMNPKPEEKSLESGFVGTGPGGAAADNVFQLGMQQSGWSSKSLTDVASQMGVDPGVATVALKHMYPNGNLPDSKKVLNYWKKLGADEKQEFIDAYNRGER